MYDLWDMRFLKINRIDGEHPSVENYRHIKSFEIPKNLQ